jgi:hypothetical protein
MRRALLPAFLLVLGAVILGATVLREPIARAASPFTNVLVGNTASNPVPVTVQNTDTNGDVKVHEQGTADVNVTNTTVPVQQQGTADVNVTNTTLPVHEQGTVQVTAGSTTDGGGSASGTPHAGSYITFNPSITASAISVHFDSTISDIIFGSDQGGVDLVKTAAEFLGPARGGTDNLNFAFSTPITFNEFICEGTAGVCQVSWTGATP